jgi:hypothetical protein
VFREHVSACFIDESHGANTIEPIGVDNAMIETDLRPDRTHRGVVGHELWCAQAAVAAPDTVDAGLPPRFIPDR